MIDRPDAPNGPAPHASPLQKDILLLKREMNAVLLAHYYVDADVQDVADHVGDSLELSRRAAETNADVIVFAGVHFMAETAKILNPEKLVLLPDLDAGCTLAESAPAWLFRAFRERHPDHLAVTYINSTAEVKALSDIICTSSSAETILRHIPSEVPVLFAPDKNLGRYLAKSTGRPMLLWQGTCTVHEQFSERKLHALQFRHPGALVVAHPECEAPVLERADFIGSTSGLLRFVREHAVREFIVATEAGILHQMRLACPDTVFHPAPPDADCACNECPYMKRNSLEKVHRCMVARAPAITLDEQLRRRALTPIERMLQLSASVPGTVPELLDGIALPFRA